MKYRGIFEYDYPVEHKPPVGIDVYLHGDCVKGKIIEWEYRPLEREPRWIPVSERMPEENRTVIASTKYGVYPEARYTKEDGWEWAYESGADYWEEIACDVLAWMPLPQPYKAESEEAKTK